MVLCYVMVRMIKWAAFKTSQKSQYLKRQRFFIYHKQLPPLLLGVPWNVFYFWQISWSYSTIKCTPRCRLHRGVDQKESSKNICHLVVKFTCSLLFEELLLQSQLCQTSHGLKIKNADFCNSPIEQSHQVVSEL